MSATPKRYRTWIACLTFVAGAMVGCKFGQLPNPHEREPVGQYDGEALQKSVQAVDAELTDRLIQGKIDRETRDRVFHDYIRDQLKSVNVEEIPNDQAWRYADVYRQLEDWQTTDALYTRAVEVAKNEDRKINDTLRLAEAKVRLNELDEGFELVRSTFNCSPGNKGAILMAVLYEFAPAALGHDRDLDVAKLLEEAITQHLLTQVDPESDEGERFINARYHHISLAWELILRVYRRGGDADAFRDAIDRSDKMLRRFAQV